MYFIFKMGVAFLAFSFKVLFTTISVISNNKDKTNKNTKHRVSKMGEKNTTVKKPQT